MSEFVHDGRIRMRDFVKLINAEHAAYPQQGTMITHTIFGSTSRLALSMISPCCLTQRGERMCRLGSRYRTGGRVVDTRNWTSAAARCDLVCVAVRGSLHRRSVVGVSAMPN